VTEKFIDDNPDFIGGRHLRQSHRRFDVNGFQGVPIERAGRHEPAAKSLDAPVGLVDSGLGEFSFAEAPNESSYRCAVQPAHVVADLIP
jgi:hypothetical protein